MGVRIRKSFRIAPGVRFNMGKKSSSISVGNKYGRTTISTSSSRKRQLSGRLKKDTMRMIRNQANVSEKQKASNKRFMKVCSVIMLIIAIIATFLAVVAFCTAGFAGIIFTIIAIPCFFFAWLFNPREKPSRKK